MLDRRNIKIFQLSRLLNYKNIESFKITRILNSIIYKLELLSIISDIHLVFYL